MLCSLSSKSQIFLPALQKAGLHISLARYAQPIIRKKTVTLIPGDGVWPELTGCMKDLFRQIGIPVEFEEIQLGSSPDEHSGDLNAVVDSLNRNKVGIKGIIRTPLGSREINTLNIRMRRILDLYANVVHIKSIPGVVTRHGKLDLVIIREQLEGEYSSLEHESVPGVVECLKIMTRRNCERIAKFAFDFAVRSGRNTVTAVHKANIMKLGDGLFLETCRNVAKLYPHIQFRSMIIDNCCMQLVSRPQQFDVMVMPNLYGNIVDNVAAGLVGGAGVVPGVSYSHELALFEPGARHSYTEASGLGIANPTGLLLASCQLLRHINLGEYAIKLESALLHVINSGNILTTDIGGRSTTNEFTTAILRQLEQDAKLKEQLLDKISRLPRKPRSQS